MNLIRAMDMQIFANNWDGMAISGIVLAITFYSDV